MALGASDRSRKDDAERQGMQGTQMRTGEVQTAQSRAVAAAVGGWGIKSVAEAAAAGEKLAALGGRAETGGQRGRK